MSNEIRESDKPSTFWQSPEGKLYGYVIHETNAGVGLVKMALNNIKKRREQGLLTPENIEMYFETFEKACKKITDGVDYGYVKLKELNGFI